MATTTPNYQWVVPTSSDLVKNGATAIETLGDSADESLWNSGYGQAGKNKVINGNFGIWQRGTTFSTEGYTADRFAMRLSGATATTTRQAFTVGQTDVPNNPTYFARLAVTTGDNSCRLETLLEDVALTSGQTFTLSFWAKGTNPAGGSLEVFSRQEFGSGGSTAISTSQGTITLTALWQKFTKTFTYASVSGKTIAANNSYGFDIRQPPTDTGTAAWTMDLANVQLEYGSYATPFQTASGGSIQGELALCQRYYERRTAGGANYGMGISAFFTSGTAGTAALTFASPKRTSASVSFSGITANSGSTGIAVATMAGTYSSGTSGIGFAGGGFDFTVASGGTDGRGGALRDSGAGTGYIEFSSEL